MNWYSPAPLCPVSGPKAGSSLILFHKVRSTQFKKKEIQNDLRLPIQHLFQKLPGITLPDNRHLLRCPDRHDLPSGIPVFGPDVDEVIRRLDHI